MDAVAAPSSSPHDPAAYHREQAAFEALEARITELWGHLNAATYRFLMLVAEFDRHRAYERHGLVDTGQWLHWQCGIGKTAAREKVRVARALEQLPQISASFARGEISYSKVRAMTRVATAATEPVLLHIALHGTASHVEKLVRKYRWTERRDAGRLAQQQHLVRSLDYFFDEHGMLVIHGRLPAEVGALVRKALEAAGDALREAQATAGHDGPPSPRSDEAKAAMAAGTWALEHEERSAPARRADALALVAKSFLAHGADDYALDPAADRYQVVLHVDQAVLQDRLDVDPTEPHACELDDGPALARDTARRLACCGTLIGLVEGEGGEPLDVGRKTRAIPAALRRALKARDGGCRFPGCDRTRFTDAHHVEHWADGGETKLGNLLTLCGFHHRLVHEGGFGVTVTDDGLFVFRKPGGQRIPEAGVAGSFRGNVCSTATLRSFRGSVSSLDGDPPETPAAVSSPVSAEGAEPHLFALNREAGLAIDAHTSRCRWLGERLDYSLAIEGMQLLRDRASAATSRASPGP